MPLAALSRSQRAEQLGWVPTPGLSAIAELPGGITQAGAVGGLLAALAAAASRPRDVLAVRGPARGASLQAEECARSDSCQAGTNRVWLLVPGERAEPLQGLSAAKAEALRDACRVERTWSVPGVTVALLTRR